MGDEAISDPAAVYKNILLIGATVADSRETCHAPQMIFSVPLVNGQMHMREFAAQYVRNSLCRFTHRPVSDDAAIMTDEKTTSECASAKRRITSRQCPNSVVSLLRNLRRAGTLK